MIVRFFFSARRVGREIRKHQECMTDKCRTENVLRASMPECESGSLCDRRARFFGVVSCFFSKKSRKADWTTANQSVSVLKQDFRETVVKMDVADIDLVWAGRCYGALLPETIQPSRNTLAYSSVLNWRLPLSACMVTFDSRISFSGYRYFPKR